MRGDLLEEIKAGQRITLQNMLNERLKYEVNDQLRSSPTLWKDVEWIVGDFDKTRLGNVPFLLRGVYKNVQIVERLVSLDSLDLLELNAILMLVKG